MQRIMLLVMVSALVLAVSATGARAAGTLAGTTITNQAFVDYEDVNGNALPRVYSNTVETVVTQVASVDVAPETVNRSGTAGSTVSFVSTVTNYGNGDDTFTLTAGLSQACTDAGWTATLYWDENGNGVRDAGEDTVVTDTGVIGADAEFSVIIEVSVPAGAAINDTCATTLTATSQFDGTVSDSGTYNVSVLDAVLSVTKRIVDTTSFQPGDVVTYAITGSNTGTATAEGVVITDAIPANTSYVTGSVRIGAVGGSYDTAAAQTDAAGDDMADYNITNAGKITVNWGDAPAGQEGVIYFKVRIADAVAAGATISNVANVDYSVGGIPQDTQQTTPATFHVDDAAAILLDPDRSSTVAPGDQIVYAFSATNQGNATDTIDLTYTSSTGWTWVLWEDVDGNGIPGTDGDFVLVDTDGDGVIDTGALAAGASIPILAVTTVPAGAGDQTVDSTVVTGTSTVDNTITDTVSLTTTIAAPVLAAAKTVSPAGNQPPGTELTYSVTVTNSGTGTATSVVISDLVPAFTSYVPESIKTGSSEANLVARTDADDGDGAHYDGGSDAVIGDGTSLGSGGTYVVQFKVTID
jgi:uncharacterized repeat protein (TIGR01451 family)